MSYPLHSARVRPASDINRVANDFGERRYTVGLLSVISQAPAEWAGQWVELRSTVACSFGFSVNPAAEVDHAVAAAADGAFAKVGRILDPFIARHYFVPAIPAGTDLYFVRSGAAPGVVQVGLASNPRL